MHAPLVRRHPAARRRHLLLPLSRRPVRHQERRAAGGPAATAAAAGCPRGSRPRRVCGGHATFGGFVTQARRTFTRDQRATIVNGMLGFVLIALVLQLWLLTATMHAWLGGDDSLVLPAALI